MRNLFFISAILFPLVLSAREYRTPDNDSILARIDDPASSSYYPLLMGRYMNGERELSADDYYHLYYGYAFQPQYSPLDPLPGMDEILTVLDRSIEPDSAGCAAIVANGKKVLRKDPFNPQALNLMAYAYTILGDTVSARTNAIRVERILRTIRDSGSGVKASSPWVVLAFSHAEDVLASLGLQAASRRVVSRTVEYIDIGRREGKIKGFFFDYGRVYWNRPERLPAQKRQGVSLNGVLL
jgi:hypothetical protein